MEVRNCKQCGKLFNCIGKPICPECLKKREEEFREVKNYIRENPSAGIAEVSEATDTSVSQIRQWIREERLVLTSESADAGINCEGCGRPIKTGRMCQSCKTQMSKSLSHAFAVEAPAKEDKKNLGRKNGDRMHYLSGDK